MLFIHRVVELTFSLIFFFKSIALLATHFCWTFKICFFIVIDIILLYLISALYLLNLY